jgi:hypothetical protein
MSRSKKEEAIYIEISCKKVKMKFDLNRSKTEYHLNSFFDKNFDQCKDRTSKRKCQIICATLAQSKIHFNDILPIGNIVLSPCCTNSKFGKGIYTSISTILSIAYGRRCNIITILNIVN